MEDIEVDGINIGCVYVSMKYYLADFLNSLVGFHRRSIFRYVRQLTFNHQYALAHNRVEFYIFDYLGAFKFGNYPPGGLFILRGVRLIFQHLNGGLHFLEVYTVGICLGRRRSFTCKLTYRMSGEYLIQFFRRYLG